MNVLRVASVPVGVGVGLLTASLWVNTSNEPCLRLLMCTPGPRFAVWQSALSGAGAAVVLLLVSMAGARLPSARVLKAS